MLTVDVPLALLEEPRRALASGTLGATLQAGDGRVGYGRIKTSAEWLGNPAASVGKAEAASWRVQTAGAASLGSLKTVLDGGELHLESRMCVRMFQLQGRKWIE